MEKIYKNFVYCLCVVLALCFCCGCSVGESGAGNNGNPKKQVKIGDYITFGKYEQDNDTSNGKEDIEWLVLDIYGDHALVISKYALDCQEYNTITTNTTWETCSLRKWLNDTFYDKAFSSDEQSAIITTTVSADKNPGHSTNSGNSTEDRVFLLSIVDANKYFSSNSARQCNPTDYVIAKGAATSSRYSSDGKEICSWWLRSPGNLQNRAASVGMDGSLIDIGNIVSRDNCAVRPAMWIIYPIALSKK